MSFKDGYQSISIRKIDMGEFGDVVGERRGKRKRNIASMSANISTRHNRMKREKPFQESQEETENAAATFLLTALKPGGQENQHVNVVSRTSSPKRDPSKAKMLFSVVKSQEKESGKSKESPPDKIV